MHEHRGRVGFWLRFCVLLSVASLLLPTSLTEPYDPNLGTTIDTFLLNQGSPIVSNGSVFFSNGVTWNVDPRLIVAIAGAESSFGLHICSAYNAWNWFWNGYCASPFTSWADGIATVTKFMRLHYLNPGFYSPTGLTSIPLIGSKYCASGCQNWVPNVTTFYTGLGGDVSDLGFVAPQQHVTFLSFTEGNPGLPGDGVFVTVPNAFTSFHLSQPISLAQVNDGITITFFLPTDIQTFQSGLVVLGSEGSACFGAAQVFAAQKVAFNGVIGYAVNFTQAGLQSVPDLINRVVPGCAVTLADLPLTGLRASSGVFRFVTSLDAASIGIGQNAFPGTQVR